MDPTLVNLNAISGQFISENSEIPPDIIFKFASAGGEHAEVAAHKMILAMVSQVFRNMFFTHKTVDMNANEMMMEDTTKPAFQMMIDAVYNVKPLKISLQGKSVHEIFAVLYLVTKYKISQLELAVKECLSSLPISEENVVEVADDAMEYLDTFGEAAQSLLLACAKFLKSNLTTDYEYFVRVVAENSGRMATVQKLAALIKGFSSPPGPPTCSNCKKVSYKCLNGQAVTETNVKIGIKVVQNPLSTYMLRMDTSGTGVLVKKKYRKWLVCWENNQENDWSLVYGLGYHTYYTLLFKCH